MSLCRERKDAEWFHLALFFVQVPLPFVQRPFSGQVSTGSLHPRAVPSQS